ncbi:MAG: hypothetical protein RID91_09010, partial [Azospirillaceae bacterium]
MPEPARPPAPSPLETYWSYPPWRHPRTPPPPPPPPPPAGRPGGGPWRALAGPVAVVALSLIALGVAAGGIALAGLAAPVADLPAGAAPGGGTGLDRVALQHAAVRLTAGILILVALRIAARTPAGLGVFALLVLAGLATGEVGLRLEAVRLVALVDPLGAGALPTADAARLTAAGEASFRVVMVAGWLATLGFAFLALPSTGPGLAPARLREKRRLFIALAAASVLVFALVPAAAWSGSVAETLARLPP